MKLVLDTNAYSDWRRFGIWADVLGAADQVLVPAIVLGELRAGFQLGQKTEANEAQLEAFLAFPVVSVISVGEETSWCYATLKNYLRAGGKMIPENDVWIAACCYESGATLLTSDKHFERMPQVRLARRES